MKANSILETIGRTPHVRINRLFGSEVEVWMKQERLNPANSIKDRIALAMVEDAERRGIINSETTIIEPTSGNTGVALAMVAAAKGMKIILVMPESFSLERRRLITAFGAKLVLTPREKGITGAVEAARDIASKTENSWIPMQFDNAANVEVHKRTTAREILEDFPEGIDFVITGVGTGGHIMACAEVLKPKFPRLKVIAVEPEKSTVLSGGSHTPHKLQGIAPGFVPSIVDLSRLDGFIQVSEEAAFEMARRAAREEGIFVGTSSGASLAAIQKKLPELPKGSRVLTFCYDTGERYLSVEGLFPAEC